MARPVSAQRTMGNTSKNDMPLRIALCDLMLVFILTVARPEGL